MPPSELDAAAPLPKGLAELGFRFCHAFRVRYRDIDAQGIVFNGNYMAYIDYGITEYFRHLGFTFNQVHETDFDLAVVKAVQEFRAPAYYDDILYVGVRVVRIGRSSFTARYCIWREEEDGGTVIMDAEVTYVNYDVQSRRSRRIPDRIRQAISALEGGLPGETVP